MKKYFFELPVYRLSEKDYEKEEDTFLLKYYNEVHLRNGRVNSSISYEEFKEKSMLYRDIWQYNEIIGYIKLYILGSQIRGEYYQHKTSRIRKTRTKHFKFLTLKLVSESNLSNKTNEEIYNIILKYIEDCNLELQKRYIDIKYFKQIGKFVDWNNLIKDSSICKN